MLYRITSLVGITTKISGSSASDAEMDQPVGESLEGIDQSVFYC